MNDAVTIAYVYSNGVSHSWHHSLTRLLKYDLVHHNRVWRGDEVAIRSGTDGLVESRNRAVREFLADHCAPWLWWVDTDMGFAPDTVDRLLEAADSERVPIVGGLCFSQRELRADGMGGWYTMATPTIFDWGRLGEQQGFGVRWDYPRNQLVRCAGTGSACILIHRSVFERIRDACGETWYDRMLNPTTNQLFSEDLSFCRRATLTGIPVAVHTGVGTTHDKHAWVSEDQYWRERLAHSVWPGQAQGEASNGSSMRAMVEEREADRLAMPASAGADYQVQEEP